MLLARYRESFQIKNRIPFDIPVNHQHSKGAPCGFRWVLRRPGSFNPANEDRDVAWFQALLLQITVQHQCSGGLNDQHLVLVNRLRQLHALKSVFYRRSGDSAACDLRALLPDARSAATALALASHLQLETSVRAAGATARVCTLWQLRPRFLSSADEGHGRASVALTRSLSATYVVSPPDPRGLIGASRRPWRHGKAEFALSMITMTGSLSAILPAATSRLASTCMARYLGLASRWLSVCLTHSGPRPASTA